MLTGTNYLPCYASRQAGMGSIPFGSDPFNSDLAGCHLAFKLFSVVNSVFVITFITYYVIRYTVKESALHCQSLNSTIVMC